MMALKYLLVVMADLMFVASFAMVINDVWLRLAGVQNEPAPARSAVSWRKGLAIGALAWVPLMLSVAIASAS